MGDTSVVSPLRKRTGRVNAAEALPENQWDLFKERMIKKIPTIEFIDEYVDDNVVSASVAGVAGNDFSELIKLMKSGVLKSSAEDGRIVIEFDMDRKEKVNLFIPNMLSTGTFWVIVVWLLLFIVTVRFIISNHEMYMKLL